MESTTPSASSPAVSSLTPEQMTEFQIGLLRTKIDLANELPARYIKVFVIYLGAMGALGTLAVDAGKSTVIVGMATIAVVISLALMCVTEIGHRLRKQHARDIKSLADGLGVDVELAMFDTLRLLTHVGFVIAAFVIALWLVLGYYAERIWSGS